ncbi:RNA-directed DNA polymerase, eukaryota, reverse transcriptase zinc-binding domain protein [Tanacetum coccineum]
MLAAKEKGGLGVSSLFALNRALLMKWFWRFYSHNDSLWSRVIKAIYGVDGEVNKVSKYASRSCWRDIINEVRKLKDQGINMRDFMYIKVGNGKTTKFWDDIWIGSKPLKLLFPRIYALDNIKDATICMKLNEPSLDNNFRRSIRGGIEQSQFKELTDLLIPIVLNPCPDRWFWSLEGSGEFSVASIRRFIDDQRLLTVDSKTLWIKSVPIKVNILAWKIKLEALPTRFNISRRGIEIDSILCPICDRGVESTRHIFFSCCLVRQIARKICSWWDIEYSDVNSFTEWINWMASLRLQSKVKMMIQGVFFVVWWLVWSYRNKLLFEEKKPSKAIIFDDVVSISFYWSWTMDVSANTIANCFRHCKLRSTDNMTFENSDEGGESTQELQNLIKELGYRNAMDVEDVLTHPEENVVAQLLTDEEIIESVIGINKDDIDEEDDESSTMEPPSRNEAIKAAITLNNFLLSYEKTTPRSSLNLI